MAALLMLPWASGRLLEALGLRLPVSRSTLWHVGLGLVFLFTGMGHFVKTDGMVEMLPPWLPLRREQVLVSGLLEWLLAVGFLVPRTRRLACRAGIAFLILVLPINVWAAFHEVELGGHAWGPVYLWIRVPLQLLLVAWCIPGARRRGQRQGFPGGETEASSRGR